MPLTESQLAFYSKNGFVGPIKIIEPDAIGSWAGQIEKEVLEESDASRSIYGVHGNRDIHLYSRILFDLCTHRALVECLQQLLGRDVLLWRTTAFYKPPLGGGSGFGE